MNNYMCQTSIFFEEDIESVDTPETEIHQWYIDCGS